MEQYLRFFVDHRQKDWPDWLAIVEFAVNNKTHLATKILLFMPSYSRKLRIEVDIRRKRKVKKKTEVSERMKRVQEKAGAVLKKAQCQDCKKWTYFFFLFDLFSFILFLELGLGLEWRDHAVTQQVTSDDMVTSHMTHRRT